MEDVRISQQKRDLEMIHSNIFILQMKNWDPKRLKLFSLFPFAFKRMSPGAVSLHHLRYVNIITSHILHTQSCSPLCHPMDCSPSGSSAYWIFQARILEWVAIFTSRGSFWPRDRTQVSCIEGRLFIIWAIREIPYCPPPLS